MQRRHLLGAALAGTALTVPSLRLFAATSDYDLVIRGGRVMDPSQGLDMVADVAGVTVGIRRPSVPSAGPFAVVPLAWSVCLLGVVAAGQNLVVLGGREGIDLSVGGIISFTAFLAGNLMQQQDALRVIVRDDAALFDPTRALTAPLDVSPLDRARPGGFGVELMHRLVDQLDYRITGEGQNELTLLKRRT